MSENSEQPKIIYEENSFVELFGGESKTVMKMLETLLNHPTVGYTKKDLAEVNEMARSSVTKNWGMLTKHDLIEVKQEKYGTTEWKLNQDSEIVEQLYKLSDAVQKFRREEGLAETRKLEEEAA